METKEQEEVAFEYAIGFDTTLKTGTTQTPFEFNFIADFYFAMFATNSDKILPAEEYSDTHGEFKMRRSAGGNAVSICYTHVAAWATGSGF